MWDDPLLGTHLFYGLCIHDKLRPTCTVSAFITIIIPSQLVSNISEKKTIIKQTVICYYLE